MLRQTDKHLKVEVPVFPVRSIWVLRADDPKSLKDIDAILVTIEANGCGQHLSGEQVLVDSLRRRPVCTCLPGTDEELPVKQRAKIPPIKRFNSLHDEAKSPSLARMAERISKEAETLPYR